MSSENFNLGDVAPTLATALEEMQHIMGKINQLGANDYEMSALQQLITQLAAGNIAPVAAIRSAQQIINSKQDYH